jgi:hypothetical protein
MRQSCFQHRLVTWCWYAVNFLILSVGRYTVLWWSVIPSWCMNLTAKPLLALKSYCGIFRDTVTSIAFIHVISGDTKTIFTFFYQKTNTSFIRGIEICLLGSMKYLWVEFFFFYCSSLCVFSIIQFSWHRICVLWHSHLFYVFNYH